MQPLTVSKRYIPLATCVLVRGEHVYAHTMDLDDESDSVRLYAYDGKTFLGYLPSHRLPHLFIYYHA